MYDFIIPRHVKNTGSGYTYVLSLAGKKAVGGSYRAPMIACYEAELLKFYVRNKYGVKWFTMRASIPESTLQTYVDECGFKLTLSEVFQHLPERIRETLDLEGARIADKFKELELPLNHKELVKEAVREEREGFKRGRMELKAKHNKENATVWRAAQNDVALAWRDAKLDVEAVREFLRDAIHSGVLGNSRQLQAEALLRRLEKKT